MMKPCNLPSLSARYWTAMSIASVFGANMGDFVSHNLHLGHANGLPVLALAFAAILLLERRERAGGEAYYWLAVVVLRTAATNLADLATHDFKLDGILVSAGLAVLLVAVLVVRRPPEAPGRDGLPAVDGRYWLALGVAGTLGTALGDTLADVISLPLASGLTVAAMAAALAARRWAAFAGKPFYWGTIVTVRTAGTNVGDLLASGEGFGLGLPVSTAATGALLLGALLLWKRGADRALAA